MNDDKQVGKLKQEQRHTDGDRRIVIEIRNDRIKVDTGLINTDY